MDSIISSIKKTLSKDDDEEAKEEQDADVAAAEQELLPPPKPKSRGRRGSVLRQMDDRQDHMRKLALKERMRSQIFSQSVAKAGGIAIPPDSVVTDEEESMSVGDLRESEVAEIRKEAVDEAKELSAKMLELKAILEKAGMDVSKPEGQLVTYPLEVRVQNFGFSAEVGEASERIATVYNSSMIFPIVETFKRLVRGQKLCQNVKTRRQILENINLVFKPGRSYLRKFLRCILSQSVDDSHD